MSWPLTVRVPLIPGVNDDAENLQQVGAFVASLPGRHPVELLPYHESAAAKIAALGRDYRLPEVRPPTPEVLEQARSMVEACGVEVIRDS